MGLVYRGSLGMPSNGAIRWSRDSGLETRASPGASFGLAWDDPFYSMGPVEMSSMKNSTIFLLGVRIWDILGRISYLLCGSATNPSTIFAVYNYSRSISILGLL